MPCQHAPEITSPANLPNRRVSKTSTAEAGESRPETALEGGDAKANRVGGIFGKMLAFFTDKMPGF